MKIRVIHPKDQQGLSDCQSLRPQTASIYYHIIKPDTSVLMPKTHQSQVSLNALPPNKVILVANNNPLYGGKPHLSLCH